MRPATPDVFTATQADSIPFQPGVIEMTVAYSPARAWSAEDRLRELYERHDALAARIRATWESDEVWRALSPQERRRRVDESGRLEVQRRGVAEAIVFAARLLIDG